MEVETPEPGDFVEAPPSRVGRPATNPHNMVEMAAKAKLRPGQTLLAAKAIPVNDYYLIYSRSKREPFIDEDGEVKVKRHTVDHAPDGSQLVDIYLTYHPFTTPGD